MLHDDEFFCAARVRHFTAVGPSGLVCSPVGTPFFLIGRPCSEMSVRYFSRLSNRSLVEACLVSSYLAGPTLVLVAIRRDFVYPRVRFRDLCRAGERLLADRHIHPPCKHLPEFARR